MNAGLEMTTNRTREDDRAAYYIAGQAVVAMLGGLTSKELPETGGLGGDNCKAVESIVRALLAGMAAEDKDSWGMPPTKLDLLKDADYLHDDAVFRAVGLVRRVTSTPGGSAGYLAGSRGHGLGTANMGGDLLLRDGTATGQAVARAADEAVSADYGRRSLIT